MRSSNQQSSAHPVSHRPVSGQLRSDVQALQRLLAQQKQQLAAERSQEVGFEWEALSPSVAVLRDPLQRNGWAYTGYLGFETKQAAETTLRRLSQASPQTHYHLRKARRLPHYRWEIKATDIAPEILLQKATLPTQPPSSTVAL